MKEGKMSTSEKEDLEEAISKTINWLAGRLEGGNVAWVVFDQYPLKYELRLTVDDSKAIKFRPKSKEIE